jgi:hypothetical protein
MSARPAQVTRAVARASLIAPIIMAACALLGCGAGGNWGPWPAYYGVHATMTGLVGSGLTLQTYYSQTGVATICTLPRGVTGAQSISCAGGPSATPYDIAVRTQPSNPSQTCVVTNGAGNRP